MRPVAAASSPVFTGPVAVEPQGGVAYQAKPQTFTIWNTGTTAATYTLAATCEGAATSCAVSPASVTIGPLAAAQATVTFGIGGKGVVRLTATSSAGSANGYINVEPLVQGFRAYHVRDHCVTLALPGGAASECGDLRLAHGLPVVRTFNRTWSPVLLYNSGLAQPRLRFAFPVTPDPARAAPDSVMLNVKLADGTPVAQRKWSGWAAGSWAPGQPRRLIVSEPSTLLTGFYTTIVEATIWRAGVAELTTTSIQVPFINRSASAFGAGWWLAGLEQLYDQAANRKLWVDGQGNVAIYWPVNDTTWVAWNAERPDTLKKRLAGSTARYVRLLPGGNRVVFRATGQMDSTVTRTGQATSFAYVQDAQTQQFRLSTITMPGNAVYTFEYGATARPRLWRVRLNRDTVQRAVTFDQDADPRIRNITDPDGGVTTLAYPCCDTAQKRVIQRMNPRRLTWATYTYDATGKVTQAQLDMGAAGEGDDIIVHVNPGESRGVAPVAVPYDSAYTLVDGPRPDGDARDVTRFWIVPSMDTGIPLRIVDALGNETVLTYGDARFQNLVTRVDGPVMPDGTRQTTYAGYDARGNLAEQVAVNPLGDGRDATTWYGRGDIRWPDFVTQVTQPMGERLYIGYDAAGNRQYQQDGRGASSTVTFGWTPEGQMAWTQDQAGAMSVFQYDAAHNFAGMSTPRGHLSWTFRDVLGRDTLTVTPTDTLSPGDVNHLLATGTRVYTRHDLMDRPTLVTTVGQGRAELVGGSSWSYVTTAAETLSVKTSYNAVGQTDSVARWTAPDPAGVGRLVRRWSYDAAGRAMSETAEDGLSESVLYDFAGNVTQKTTRRGFPITLRYDALGRLTSRSSWGHTYQPDAVTISYNVTFRFPRYVDSGDGRLEATNLGGGTLWMPTQLDTFTYDPAGRLRSAKNFDAEVLRDYYPGGALKTETQRIANYDRSGWHQYVLGYHYDLDGRRTRLDPPAMLANDAITYQYDPLTGELKTVSGGNGTYQYDYTLAGQLRQLTRSTAEGMQTQEQWAYDLEGRTIQRQDISNYATLHADTFWYDARGKVLESRSMHFDATSNVYSGIGSLVWSRTERPSTQRKTTESYTVDALSNRASMLLEQVSYQGGYIDTEPSEERRYHYRAGRLVRDSSVIYGNGILLGLSRDTFDASGNAERHSAARPMTVGYPVPNTTTTSSTPTLMDFTRQFYDTQDRLRVVDRQSCLLYDTCYEDKPPYYNERPAFEEYRYDALGRRVLVRSRADKYCPQRCRNTLQRVIWDGDQVLMEISAPGATSTPSSLMEADTGLARQSPFNRSAFFYGRVLYVHGHGIDEPLAMVRYEYSDSIPNPITLLPHTNARGGVDTATYASPCFTYYVTVTRIDDGGTVGMPKPQTHCMAAAYPERHELTSHENVAQDRYGPVSWMGSLITGSTDASGQQYMRNRYYDPRSGRFTQEDPIGLAGGMNAYGYAAGDPVSYSDPYGLKVCFKGTRSQILRLKSTTQDATATTFDVDTNNCVIERSIRPSNTGGMGEIQSVFTDQVQSALVFDIRFATPADEQTNSFFARYRDGHGYVIGIMEGDVLLRYDSPRDWRIFPCLFPVQTTRWTLGAIIAHELTGHGWGIPHGGSGAGQWTAIRIENQYHRAHSEDRRCHTN